MKNGTIICTSQKFVVTLQQILNTMSASQLLASQKFLSAMGPMIEDEQKMSAVLRYILMLKQEKEPLINPSWRNQPTYTHEDFWNMAYQDLGKRYGLNDIREAK